MDEDRLYDQYLYEVSLFEKYGSKNIITFDEWKRIKLAKENTQLTTAPELPATTLAKSCYSNMFQKCTSLDESEVKLYRESLGHLPGDKETLI